MRKLTNSSIFLWLFLLICLPGLSQFSYAQTSGSGTSGDPYVIHNLADLNWMSTNVGSFTSSTYFVQDANIDASATSGSAFTPIGNSTNPFKGHYDGQSFKIDQLTINSSSTDYVGLFGYTSGANISNLGVTNANITGQNNTGALVGYANNTQITSCYSSGSVVGQSNTGGLVGDNVLNSVVKSSFSSANVTSSISGSKSTGGLSGKNDYSTIMYSYSTGTVHGISWVGGLVGYNRAGNVNNTYSYGFVYGATYVGGLVGFNYGSSSISFSYSIAPVSGGSNFGGLVGGVINSTTNNSFWDITTAHIHSSSGGTGKTDAEMMTQTTFTNAGWDFGSIWTIDAGHYPKLQANPDPNLPVELNSFTITVSKNNVVLNWQTATEVNNYGFEVQRVKAGQSNWAKVGFVKGNGTSNNIEKYSFTDKSVSSGSFQYRLKQVDNDGKFTYSNILSAEVAPEEFSLAQNYPNPFNPSTVISYQIPTSSHVTLSVYDALGRKVATLVNGQEDAGKYHVTLSANRFGLSSGIYFYSLKAGSYSAIKKFILMK